MSHHDAMSKSHTHHCKESIVTFYDLIFYVVPLLLSEFRVVFLPEFREIPWNSTEIETNSKKIPTSAEF